MGLACSTSKLTVLTRVTVPNCAVKYWHVRERERERTLCIERVYVCVRERKKARHRQGACPKSGCPTLARSHPAHCSRSINHCDKKIDATQAGTS